VFGQKAEQEDKRHHQWEQGGHFQDSLTAGIDALIGGYQVGAGHPLFEGQVAEVDVGGVAQERDKGDFVGPIEGRANPL